MPLAPGVRVGVGRAPPFLARRALIEGMASWLPITGDLLLLPPVSDDVLPAYELKLAVDMVAAWFDFITASSTFASANKGGLQVK